VLRPSVQRILGHVHASGYGSHRSEQPFSKNVGRGPRLLGTLARDGEPRRGCGKRHRSRCAPHPRRGLLPRPREDDASEVLRREPEPRGAIAPRRPRTRRQCGRNHGARGGRREDSARRRHSRTGRRVRLHASRHAGGRVLLEQVQRAGQSQGAQRSAFSLSGHEAADQGNGDPHAGRLDRSSVAHHRPARS
jgi:hypothetical protein